MINGSFLSSLQKKFTDKPLLWIILLAFMVRMLAVIFAKGYMMHDDHFLTIEPSGSWADGANFNHWLPGIGNNNPHPEPISFFYLGFLYAIFKVLKMFGLEDPDTQMYFMRFIHASYSLLIVYFGFRIAEILSDKKRAIQVGLLLAFIAILPNFSVRNLVEMVCIPPLMGGFYILLKNVPFKKLMLGRLTLQAGTYQETVTSNRPMLQIILAALLMGMAVGIRYQTGLLVALTGLIIWLFYNFKSAVLFGLVSFATFFLTQADDILLWGGEPFQHLQGYFAYNKKNALNYPGSPLAYLSFIGIFIIPPVSLFLLVGFIRSWKKQLLIFLPILGFILFHLLYPNKQERFILPSLPFFVILGVIGWNEFVSQSAFWKRKASLLRACWVFFWTLNTIAMLTLSFTYSKRDRVEAMNYLYDQGDCRNFVLEFTHSESGAMMPQFYSGNWSSYYYFKKGDDPIAYIRNFKHEEQITEDDIMPRKEPNYYLFYDDTNLQERVRYIQNIYPDLTYQTTIESGWFDRLLHWLNPKNSLEKITIYKIENFSPDNRFPE
jgi:hypothetical protein